MQQFSLLPLIRCACTLFLFTTTTTALADADAKACAMSTAAGSRKKVVVSGAGGQTGRSLFLQLLAMPDTFEPIGLVRTPESKAALLLEANGDIPESSVVVADVRNAEQVKAVVPPDCAAVMICTSAKPKPVPGEMTTDADTGGRPVFGFPDGSPEEVDWIGQKNQIDACPPGTHIVLCSTMGGTNPDHSLNQLGRTTIVHADGTTAVTGGNIVKWKRKAEVYLMNQKDVYPYTIIHPGGLTNDEHQGQRELVVGVDDETTGTDSRTVARHDVAHLMLQALQHPEKYQYRSFDVRAKPIGEGTPTTDFEHLLDSLQGRNCDYSLGETM